MYKKSQKKMNSLRLVFVNLPAGKLGTDFSQDSGSKGELGNSYCYKRK